MKIGTQNKPVKAGKPGAMQVWDYKIELPAEILEKLETQARSEDVTPEAMAMRWIRDAMRERLAAEFKERMGFSVEELDGAILSAGRDAVLAAEAVPLPLGLCVVPHGTTPVFLDSDLVSAIEGICAAADISASTHIEGWYEDLVEESLDSDDPARVGLAADILDNWGPDGNQLRHGSPQWEARRTALREAVRREKERRGILEPEAAASMEGGAK